MATTPATTRTSAFSPRRWTREEYYRMLETGLLKEDDRVELIDGQVVEKVGQKPLHVMAIQLAMRALRTAFGEGYNVRVQAPLAIGNSELEPDLAVVAGEIEDYDDHPTTAVLVVEIADSSLNADRTVKASLYASARVPDYWITNLIDRQVEVHRDPAELPETAFGFGYRTRLIFRPGDGLRPLGRPDAEIPAAALLPKARQPQ